MPKLLLLPSASHHMQFHAVPKPKIACASFACKRKFLALISILPRGSNHVAKRSLLLTVAAAAGISTAVVLVGVEEYGPGPSLHISTVDYVGSIDANRLSRFR